MVSVLFDYNTINRAKSQKLNNSEIQPIDKFNINFRLFLSKKGNINLEFLGKDQFGYYFKPIGFYEFDTNQEILSINILNEFEQPFKEIENNIDGNLKEVASFLSLEINTYIAMCSRETSNVVKKMFNSPSYNPINSMSFEKYQIENFISNGLQIQVKTSLMGSLEANLNDIENELEEDVFVIFQKSDGISLHCQEPLYNRLFEMGLLSAFK